MLNDLANPTGPLGPQDLSRIAQIAHLQADRGQAEVWAMKDCKFLVFDDTDVQENGYDSDDEEGMLAYALKMSNGQDEDPDGSTMHDAAAASPCEIEATSSKSTLVDNPTAAQHPHGEYYCRVCSGQPEFPHNRKTRKFRLFRPRDLPTQPNVCGHYVAVSYCWPLPKTGADGKIVQERRSYQVRDLDGNVRPNRVMDDVLDRAVDFANTYGLRMIWIDQECLPQPTEESSAEDWREQELGVQAMDIVYHRGTVTAGLLSSTILHQAQADAICRVSQLQQRPFILPGDITHVVNFLNMVRADRWYTRAWVVQEALSAGRTLMLVFKTAAGVKSSDNYRISGFQEPPPHSLDKDTRSRFSKIFCLSVTDFQDLVDNFKRLVASVQATVPFEIPASTMAEIQELIRGAEALHPVMEQARNLAGIVQVWGGRNYGSPFKVDAAGALSLLRTRECRYTRDMMAIMANMCRYEIRLNTQAVSKQCTSLRVALLCQAILNGDFSLFVTDAYRQHPHTAKRQTNDHVPRLLQPFADHNATLDRVRIRNFNTFRHTGKKFYDPVEMRFPAYVWIVEDFLDMTPVKAMWEDSWLDAQLVNVHAHQLDGETPGESRARGQAFAKHLSDSKIRKLATKELYYHGSVGDNSAVWDGVSSKGFKLSLNPIGQSSGKARQLVCRILFSTLQYLMNQGDTQPLAAGAASSIWQSLRVDQVSKDSEALPDHVCEELFNHADVIKNQGATLQLDTMRDGEYSQIWLIDRIMKHGVLWAGRYKSEQLPIDEGEPSDQDSTGSSTTTSHGDAPSADPKHGENEDDGEGKTILEKQVVRHVLSNLYNSIGLNDEDVQEGRREPLSSGSLTSLTLLMQEIKRPGQERRRAERLVSVFDVDGPCTVATPYSSEWEFLPRPDLRSMDVCWVVERVDEVEPVLEPVACGEARVKETGADHDGADVAGDSGQQRRGIGFSFGRYRVVNKVRGMWEIMDIPTQSYQFA
ncbi:hypothetical protein S7711_04710 [Stachybotrys chartarum IBT 7711]|uniref:Heterokaryon incompatibility domain-containing protein n=1 Tax=Stachybotrys chartarum (strain CBS 109288 / IBT 7711) TaxID=1280523 RepID=A0A084ANZ9_STACB|nr:hypothetical protein S7711_04710 [Stachybotrys chartarum IBT 7711]KFA53724.1 hypothetical protein S40293_01636 [Stachybotrys chartarum IBT 40293]